MSSLRSRQIARRVAGPAIETSILAITLLMLCITAVYGTVIATYVALFILR